MPSYNHTRADGPFDPCPQCLREMHKEDLWALIGDLRMTVEMQDAVDAARAHRPDSVTTPAKGGTQ